MARGFSSSAKKWLRAEELVQVSHLVASTTPLPLSLISTHYSRMGLSLDRQGDQEEEDCGCTHCLALDG